MKIVLNTACILSFTLLINAQSFNVHKNDGTVQSFTLSQIDSITFSSGAPCPGIPTVNYSGKTYNTVQIGTQCWLKENLDVGTMIDSLENPANNGIIEKYCYDNSPANCNTYGGLYQWKEAMQYLTTSGAKGICPEGWHVPTLSEFDILKSAVGDDGNALKAIGQGSGDETNTSGFSALLAGYSGPELFGSSFHGLNSDAHFWSSTEYDATYAYNMRLYYSGSLIYFYDVSKEGGFSVRCLKD